MLRKEGDPGAVERLLCVCYLLFCIVRSGYYGKLFLTPEETSNANAAGDSGHLAHHLNRLERLFFVHIVYQAVLFGSLKCETLAKSTHDKPLHPAVLLATTGSVHSRLLGWIC